MQDRFRFRAWDKNNKRMLYNIENAYDFGGVEDEKGNEVEDCYADCFSSFLPYDEEDENEKFVVEQCTGLRDKNGRLIYEGDILSTSNKDHQHDIWEPEDWGYTFIYWNEKNLCFAGTKWFIDGPEEESVFNAEFVEIVGNIHENPELLEELK